jgi:type I restriction enzyme M protein
LRLEHLRDFIEAYKPGSRRDRIESEHFKRFGYDELVQRDKVSLDLIWLRDDSLEDMDNLPPPQNRRARPRRRRMARGACTTPEA